MEVLNVNVGILGHVDSGKTSLVKALSTVLSTASLDKHPQVRKEMPFAPVDTDCTPVISYFCAVLLRYYCTYYDTAWLHLYSLNYEASDALPVLVQVRPYTINSMVHSAFRVLLQSQRYHLSF